MIIVGTFEQSIELEQALAVLEKDYVSRNQILVVFMNDEESPNQLSGRTRDIRSNAFEVGLASATGSAVIGASVGFTITFGPIICGLSSAIIGFSIGYSLYYFSKKKNKKNISLHQKMPEVTVIIQATKQQACQIKNILWKYKAITVGESLSIE